MGKAASIYEIPPFSLNFYRWLFAWLILFPFTYKEIIKKKDYVLKNLGFFIILGITSITIFNSIVYYSLNFTQVICGVLMISTIPSNTGPSGISTSIFSSSTSHVEPIHAASPPASAVAVRDIETA